MESNWFVLNTRAILCFLFALQFVVEFGSFYTLFITIIDSRLVIKRNTRQYFDIQWTTGNIILHFANILVRNVVLNECKTSAYCGLIYISWSIKSTFCRETSFLQIRSTKLLKLSSLFYNCLCKYFNNHWQSLYSIDKKIINAKEISRDDVSKKN